MSTSPPKLPDILEKMADVVLAHKKPKATKAKLAKKRKKKATEKKGGSLV
jgi:hypothetical protein